MSQTAGAEPVWEQKLDDAALRLAEEATAEALADVYGGDQSFVDDLCSEVVSVAIDQGDNVVTMDHFATAADRLDAVPENDDTDTDRHVAPHREMKGDGAGGEVVASTTDVDEGTIADIQADRDADVDETDDQDCEEETAAESADGDPSESDGDDEQPARIVEDGVEYVPREEYEELEAEVQDLRGLVDALHRQVKNQTRAITGDEHMGSIDPEHPSFTDLMTRLQQVEDRTEEHASRLQMVRTDGAAGTDSPDDRARLLRQQLYNMAKSGANKSETEAGRATMTRDEANARLGGELHNGTVLDAMRRAADGYEADIGGSSDLQPVESITFQKSDSHESQSKLVIDLADASGSEVRQSLTASGGRQNLMTADTEDGG